LGRGVVLIKVSLSVQEEDGHLNAGFRPAGLWRK
jgi:hypothetical protein